jgi:ABC-type protease/lipase transport system fused ATPase/permease subunit
MKPDRLPRSLLAAVLSSFRGALAGLALMSGLINLLALTGSFFMLQVYDRVIPSRSVPTLVGLAFIALTLFAFQGALELLRTRLLGRIGLAIDQRLGAAVYSAVVRLSLRSKADGDGLQPLRDLDSVRGFLSGPGPTALFDMPWIPLYLGICFLFHVWIGIATLAGAILLTLLALLTEFLARQPARQASLHASERNGIARMSRHNSEAVQAMGFLPPLIARWSAVNAALLGTQLQASDVAASLGALSRSSRMVLQSGVLAIGALLVIEGKATGGIIIASSIIMSRALAPSSWRLPIGVAS